VGRASDTPSAPDAGKTVATGSLAALESAGSQAWSSMMSPESRFDDSEVRLQGGFKVGGLTSSAMQRDG
jgi:hypothetical protein